MGLTEKKRYTLKLGMVGLILERDPYQPANAGNFVTDMTAWPRVEYGHIFCQLYSMPWNLHARAVAFLEVVGCVQLLSE